jgi:hypothetical protein
LSGDAAIQLPMLSRVIGAQLELSRARQRQALQQRFAEIFQANLAPDMIATRALEELVEISGAGGASLIVTRAGGARALATIGSPPPLAGVSEPDAWIFAADRIVCPFPIGKDMSVAVHMRPLEGHTFTAASAMATRVGVEVLRTWASGAGLSLDDAETTCGQITVDELERGHCRTRGVLAGVPDCRSLAVAGYAGR